MSGSGEDENVKSLQIDGQTVIRTPGDKKKLTWAIGSGGLKIKMKNGVYIYILYFFF